MKETKEFPPNRSGKYEKQHFLPFLNSNWCSKFPITIFLISGRVGHGLIKRKMGCGSYVCGRQIFDAKSVLNFRIDEQSIAYWGHAERQKYNSLHELPTQHDDECHAIGGGVNGSGLKLAEYRAKVNKEIDEKIEEFTANLQKFMEGQ